MEGKYNLKRSNWISYINTVAIRAQYLFSWKVNVNKPIEKEASSSAGEFVILPPKPFPLSSKHYQKYDMILSKECNFNNTQKKPYALEPAVPINKVVAD